MRTREERKLFKHYKYLLKQYRAELTYKHGIYTIKWAQREGPMILLDLYNYTLTDTNLENAVNRYIETRKCAY